MNNNYKSQISDYLADKLDKAERDAFEITLLEDRDLQAALEVEKALKRGLGDLDGGALGGTSGSLGVGTEEGPGVESPSAVAPPRPSLATQAMRWAVAVSLCLVVSLYFNLQHRPGGSIDTVGEIVYIEPVRSAAANTYAVNAGDTALLAISLSDPAALEAAVSIEGDRFSLPVRTLSVSRDGFINVLLPRLEPGRYRLRLVGADFEDNYELALQ